MREKIAVRLKKALSFKGMSQTDLINKTGISKSLMSAYINDKAEPRQNKIGLLAKALDINEAWLMGYDVPMEREVKKKEEDDIFKYKNVLKLVTVKVPFLGSVQCGTPHEAIENAEVHDFQFPEDFKMDFDFALACEGDSMVNDGIDVGDVVFIKKQEWVNNGEMAVIVIDGEATLKRFHYHKENNMVILKAGNSTFEDLIYIGEKLEEIRVVGKVVSVLKEIK